MKKKTQLIIWIILAILALALCTYLCVNIVMAKTHEVQNPVATFEIENYGTVKLELYPEYAPNTVANFINLINKGFYTGKVFYGKDVNAIYAAKTAEGEDVQPTMSLVDSSVEAGSESDTQYQINGEFVANDFQQNTLKHERGVISMLRENYSSYFGLTEQGYNSASSHFQIMLENNRNLNGMYAAFGKVIEGLDVVEKVFNSETVDKTSEGEEANEGIETDSNTILDFANPAVIKNATVETYGVDYGVPEVHQAFDYNEYLQNYFNQYYTNES